MVNGYCIFSNYLLVQNDFSSLSFIYQTAVFEALLGFHFLQFTIYHLPFTIKNMEVYFQLIKDAEGVKKACELLKNEDYLGFDTETTALDPYDGVIRLVQLSNGKDTTVIDLKPFADSGDLKTMPELAPLRELISAPKPIKVAHNAKFDAKWIRHHFGIDVGGIFDTLVASQLIAAGDQDRRHNLAEVANFFLGIEVDKSEQVSDWAADELSQSQIQYAAKDAAIMVALREKVVERLKQDELIKVAKLEFDCVAAVAQMELNGFFLDEVRWREQLVKVKKEQEIVALELQKMLSAGVAQASLFGVAEINLDSQNQVTDALKNLGVPVPETTRGWQLQPLALEYPVVAKLLEYRGVAKSISSFGDNILEFIKPKTGRIHADFRQIGAPTGRFSCNKPNLQQIPHEEAYRRCFRAPEGKKLVVADYSQIELRILAEFSDDENFINAFKSGADFHTITAAQTFNVKAEEVTGDQRSFAKRLNFGVVYGIGSQRFALMTGLSQTQAEDIMRKYFGTYRGLDKWLRDAAKTAVNERLARTASGRMVRFRFDPEDRKAASGAQRNGKNFPIQGTSADILKRALHLLHSEIHDTSAKLVNIVHDEVILECNAEEAEKTADTLSKTMCAAGEEYVKKVPVKVDVKITDEWSK